MLANLNLGLRKDQDLREIDNFLEANLDAKLVHDEVEINKKVNSLEGDDFFNECKQDFSGNKN